MLQKLATFGASFINECVKTRSIVDTATVISYNYNANGELVSETSNNGSVSETTAYEYDLNGNLTKKTKGFSVTDYTYNAWNQMVSAGNVTYTYNAQGLRVSKTSSGETDTFTLVGGNVWSDSESKYLRGIELIASDTQIYLYNIRGDVIQLLGFDGEVDKTYDYDAYGNVSKTTYPNGTFETFTCYPDGFCTEKSINREE